MNILHLLATGETGGIEVLNKEIYLHSRHNNYFCFAFKGGIIADEMKKSGADVTLAETKNPFKLLKKIIQIIKGNEIDAVMTHHAAPLVWIIATVASVLCKLPLYVYIHGAIEDALRIDQRKLTCLKKMIFSVMSGRAKNIIAISKSVEESIARMYPERKHKIRIIYNGVDLSRYTYRDNKEDDRFTILYVGRLFKKKGVDRLLKALSLLSIPYRCLIIGDGPEKENLYALSEKLNLNSDKVEFCGVQRDISGWHNKADIFVHPAIWEEGFGITLIESMASGLPCIAFKKGAIPEIIDDGKNGFIVDKDTPEELAKVISKVYNIKSSNPIEWENIRNRAVERSKFFSIEKMVDSLDKMVDN